MPEFIAVAGEDIKKGETVAWNSSHQVVRYKPPPPKQYDFAEAYAMMKQGKWMRRGETGTPQEVTP